MNGKIFEQPKTPDRRSAPTTAPLHGRVSQVERIETALCATAESSQGRVILLESPAGSGKTRLLLEAVAVARRRGFAMVDRIVDTPWQANLATRITSVPPAAGRPSKASIPEADRLAWLIGQVEAQLDGHLRRGPVLVVLDDAQCADPLVLRTLSVLVLKLVAAPVLWLFAMRSEDADSPNGLWLHNLARSHRTEWLPALEPLDDDAVAGLVGDLLDADPSEDVLALGESLGGSPQAVVDLARGLLAENCLRISGDTACLAGGRLPSGLVSAVASDPGAHLPHPFLKLMHQRLERLAPATQKVLQVAAVLGMSFTPHDLAEMLGERPANLLGPLQEALTAGLVACRPEEFVFHREPIHHAVLGTVPSPMRSLLHRQAAHMILTRAGGETEAAAVHLVHCAEAGDVQAVNLIRAVATRLLPTSPQSAAALALRGLEIIDLDQPEYIALATTATVALVRAGGLRQAVELAESVVALHKSADEGHATYEAGMWPLRAWLSTALLLRGDASAALQGSQGALRHSDETAQGGVPHPLLLRLNALFHTDETAAVAAAERVLAAEERHNGAVRVAALNVSAMARWRDGRIDEAFDLLDRAAALRSSLTDVWPGDPLWTKAWMLTRVRRLDEAMSTVETVRRTIDSEGIAVLNAVPLALRAWVHLARGELAEAEADATAGIKASIDAQMPLCEPHLHAALVVAALRRGDLTTAVEQWALLEDLTSDVRSYPWWAMRCLVTAQVTAARRGVQPALEVLREIHRDPGKRGQLVLEDPSATAWCVRTALAAGDRETATLIAATADEISATACSHPTVAAAAAHGRALLTRDIEALTGVAGSYGDPWATASATEDLGALLCASDRERAIAELSTAMAAYAELGAEWDSARVRRRLRRLGVRRRHWNHAARPQTGWGSLTGTEEKVARLVARGLTNRQVAGELFVSPHTVGFHLRQIYRKLEIQSRVDLARIACTRGSRPTP